MYTSACAGAAASSISSPASAHILWMSTCGFRPLRRCYLRVGVRADEAAVRTASQSAARIAREGACCFSLFLALTYTRRGPHRGASWREWMHCIHTPCTATRVRCGTWSAIRSWRHRALNLPSAVAAPRGLPTIRGQQVELRTVTLIPAHTAGRHLPSISPPVGISPLSWGFTHVWGVRSCSPLASRV